MDRGEGVLSVAAAQRASLRGLRAICAFRGTTRMMRTRRMTRTPAAPHEGEVAARSYLEGSSSSCLPLESADEGLRECE